MSEEGAPLDFLNPLNAGFLDSLDDGFAQDLTLAARLRKGNVMGKAIKAGKLLYLAIGQSSVLVRAACLVFDGPIFDTKHYDRRLGISDASIEPFQGMVDY